MYPRLFKDREDAAKKLAEKLKQYAGRKDAIVLGIPRGGVVTAKVVAEILQLPLSVLIVRKIPAPLNEEVAIGAVSTDFKPFLSTDAIRMLAVSKEYLREILEKKKQEVKERMKLFGAEHVDVKNKVVLLVDDGIATGSTILAGVKCLKQQGPKKLVVAVPVSPVDTAELLKKEVDEFVCLETPEPFMAVGQFYGDFRQVENEEVVEILKKSKRP